MSVHDFLVTLLAMLAHHSVRYAVHESVCYAGPRLGLLCRSPIRFAMPVDGSVCYAGPRLSVTLLAMPVHDSVCYAGPRLSLLCWSMIRFAMSVYDFSVILFALFRRRITSASPFSGVLRTGLSAIVISPGSQACNKWLKYWQLVVLAATGLRVLYFLR